MTHKNITNAHFVKLKDVINSCLGSYMSGISIISNMQDASFDNENNYYVYPSTAPVNLDVIKLDDITKYRKHFLLPKINFDPLSGVDAICINSQNEWFFLEFKNCDIKNNSKARQSIRKKMIESIWYVFFLYSISGENITSLFSGDITKFARENINYVIVGSQTKNTHYQLNIQAAESVGKHYTPPGFEQFKGYYFKDVYMLTEIELRDFILHFKA
ncbi:hypothetical protein [uncultured Ruminococcus sp.]|uniref:hypothetical protein n=1 Tax=uncultured Ruminococcus sp. TaxID=165186 RepID=UPI0026170113|nr:hypothetical protein [uncultured Ruminococcus sp.]